MKSSDETPFLGTDKGAGGHKFGMRPLVRLLALGVSLSRVASAPLAYAATELQALIPDGPACRVCCLRDK